jgi:hypothetical protein
MPLLAVLAMVEVADVGAPADQKRSRFGVGLISGALALEPEGGSGLAAPVATVAGFDLRLGTRSTTISPSCTTVA